MKSKPFVAFLGATLLGGTFGITQLATAANSDAPQPEAPVASLNFDSEVVTSFSEDLTYTASISPSSQPSTGAGTVSEVTFTFFNSGDASLDVGNVKFEFDNTSPFSYQANSTELGGFSYANPDITEPVEPDTTVTGLWPNEWTVPAAVEGTPGSLVLTFDVLVAAQTGGPYTISLSGDVGETTFGPASVAVTMVPAPTANAISGEGTQGAEIVVLPAAAAAPGYEIDQSQTCLFAPASPETCLALLDLGEETGTLTFSPETNSITFNPAELFVGEAAAAYRVTDTLGQTATANITLSTFAPPVVTPLTTNATVNNPTQLTPLATPAQGLTMNTAATCVRSEVDGVCQVEAALGEAGILQFDNVTGNIIFTPGVDYTGTVTGYYSMTDSLGGVGTASVTIQVVDATTAGDVTITVAAGGDDSTAPLVTLAEGATLESTCVRATLEGGGCGATADVTGGVLGYNAESNLLTFNSDGLAPANPIVGYYQVTDSLGGTAIGEVTIVVVPNPTASAVTITTGVKVAATDTLTGTPDSRAAPLNTAATCIQTTQGQGASCVASLDDTLGNFTVANSVLTFTPATNANPGTATIYYRVVDALGGKSAPTAITVTLVAAPTAEDVIGAATQGTAEVLVAPNATAASQTTLDTAETCLSATAQGPCTTSLPVTEGTFTFLPQSNKIKFVPTSSTFVGTSQAFYTVKDEVGSTAQARVTVAYAPLSPIEEPAKRAQPGQVLEVLNVAAAAGSGWNPATVQVSVDSGVTWHSPTVVDDSVGTWDVDGQGRVFFTSNVNYTGSATSLARIQGSDPVQGGGLSALATVEQFQSYSLDVVVGEAVEPNAPTSVVATAGDASATIIWTAPTDNGGSEITQYAITSSPASDGCLVNGTTTSCEVTGLENGTAYTFTAVASNAIGDSPPSAPSNVVTPTASTTGVPAPPTNVTATAGNASATVRWDPPTDTGSSPIREYVVTSQPGGEFCSATTATTCQVTGLTNGTSYTFTVVAINATGPSPASAPSNAVTPSGSGPNPGPTISPVPVPTGSNNPNVTPTNNGSLPTTGADLLTPTVFGILFVIAGAATIAFSTRRQAQRYQPKHLR